MTAVQLLRWGDKLANLSGEKPDNVFVIFIFTIFISLPKRLFRPKLPCETPTVQVDIGKTQLTVAIPPYFWGKIGPEQRCGFRSVIFQRTVDRGCSLHCHYSRRCRYWESGYVPNCDAQVWHYLGNIVRIFPNQFQMVDARFRHAHLHQEFPVKIHLKCSTYHPLGKWIPRFNSHGAFIISRKTSR
jgi:hypothetical protein